MKNCKKGLFTIDDLEINYVGYHNDDSWLGWACPCFEKDVVIEMLKDDFMQCCYSYSYENDTFILKPNEGFGDDVEEYKGFDIMFNDEIKHVYAIGAYIWCWDEVED